MELPKKILVGPGSIRELGSFAEGLGVEGKLLVVAGPNVYAAFRSLVSESMARNDFPFDWMVVESATMDEVSRVQKAAVLNAIGGIIGLGGGKSVDVAKLAAFRADLPFISVPTSASHDGISSPFASIKGLNKPYSFVARPPLGIVADTDLVASAPRRLFVSGCGDLVAKVTAVRDWELGRDDKHEYFGKYAANLALLSASIVIEGSKEIGRGSKDSVRDVVEALISAGVAAGIAGSSRPCSGSEHLFSHALDMLAPGVGLHGEKCGVGAIMTAKLHGLDWQRIVSALHDIGAPTTGHELGIAPNIVAEALAVAPSIRPERYTILSKVKLSRESAAELARSTGVI